MAAPTKIFTMINFIKRMTVPSTVLPCNSFHTFSGPQLFRVTTAVSSMPMKKKRKVDPTIALAKEAKKRNKLVKVIVKLKSKNRILKPIEEYQKGRSVLKNIEQRKRRVPKATFEEQDSRVRLTKDWARYKYRQHMIESSAISRARRSEERALRELREESEKLYQLAIQRDETFIPYCVEGPSNTPPNKSYDPPDGEYIDTTPKFDKILNTKIDLKKLQ